ncbi:MAG: signal peptidase II [Ignavibacteriaceae bacterium]|nr:signal peptidase II [Ignavibacteriaceae bacterium]
MKVLFVSLAVLIIDQFSKFYIKGFSFPFLKIHHSGMYQGQRHPLWGDLFNITFVENSGIAFGLSFGDEFKVMVSLFTIAAGIALFYYLLRIKDKPLSLRLSVALIIGGALGNLIDRIFYGVFYGYSSLFYGRVVDFFDIRIFNLLLFDKTIGNYVFNFADVAVTTGVILLMFVYGKKESEEGVKNLALDNKE